MTVTVLMLQALAGQSRAARSAPDQKSTRSHVSSRPDQVANPLETEHGVINEEGDSIDAVGRVCSAGGDERAHRACFSNAFLQDLPVQRFLVVEQCVHVDRFVKLSDAGINAYLPE